MSFNLGSAWADIRDKAFEEAGLTTDIRNELQPFVDQAKDLGGNIFQLDGYVPPNTQGISGTTVLPRQLSFLNQNIFGIPAWLFVAVILGLIMVLVLKGRK